LKGLLNIGNGRYLLKKQVSTFIIKQKKMGWHNGIWWCDMARCSLCGRFTKRGIINQANHTFHHCPSRKKRWIVYGTGTEAETTSETYEKKLYGGVDPIDELFYNKQRG